MFDGASWWFGCYGKPAVLLRADKDLKFNGRWEFPASVGIAHLGNGRFLLAENTVNKETKMNAAKVRFARADEGTGMMVEK